MFFIILATALTLHRAGITMPDSSRQVAEALQPLAGRFASLLYAVGLVGTGALAVPTLAGSAAYAVAELFGWYQGIDGPYGLARPFYAAFRAGAPASALERRSAKPGGACDPRDGGINSAVAPIRLTPPTLGSRSC